MKGTLHMSPITTITALSQPFLDGRSVQNAAAVGKTDHMPRQNQDLQPHTAVAPDKVATSADLQPNGTSSTRETERTARLMCKRAQHEVLYMVLTFLIGDENAVLNVRRVPSILKKKKKSK